MSFTPAELAYLQSQYLGRLATVDGKGAPQNNPVGFSVNDDGSIDIGGRAMGASKKFRNVQANPSVALVIDDLASVNPWTVRGVEIRGEAETVVKEQPADSYMSSDFIRIHPRRVVAWGVEPDAPGMTKRSFAPEST